MHWKIPQTKPQFIKFSRWFVKAYLEDWLFVFNCSKLYSLRGLYFKKINWDLLFFFFLVFYCSLLQSNNQFSYVSFLDSQEGKRRTWYSLQLFRQEKLDFVLISVVPRCVFVQGGEFWPAARCWNHSSFSWLSKLCVSPEHQHLLVWSCLWLALCLTCRRAQL